jgi:hypothetical protein
MRSTKYVTLDIIDPVKRYIGSGTWHVISVV